jgi:hypothetical protein
MYIHPHIGRQLADERRRELLAAAQHERLVRQLRTESAAARGRQRLANRLWLRLRPVRRPRLEPQARLEPQE